MEIECIATLDESNRDNRKKAGEQQPERGKATRKRVLRSPHEIATAPERDALKSP